MVYTLSWAASSTAASEVLKVKHSLVWSLVILSLVILPAQGARAAQAAEVRDAWWYLEYQVGLGPRNPGSAGHRELTQFLQAELARYADTVLVQDFSTVYDSETLAMRNVAGLFLPEGAAAATTTAAPPSLSPYMIFGAHFDTRPRADWDPDPAKQSTPIIGANDGGSGVAVLLELAGYLAERRPPFPVMLAFFDGEDLGTTAADMFLGSKQFAAAVNPSDVMCMILLDMVGDADLKVHMEGYSASRNPALTAAIWDGAAAIGYGSVFPRATRHYILDDHIPFLERGIPAVDIIDFDYPYWHTTSDTIDKCSRESLSIVRDVVLEAIYGGRVQRLFSGM
ncbi:MAG: Aminopeptidase YwaD precursor [Firmicutes bacterium ADurb.Bin506]|jgi:glutaminyl-peptide cyclotransferase|nr:MAG: Aminopeptidase YwaD precursor [Firmicutes bacterium ADurb.Bin506]